MSFFDQPVPEPLSSLGGPPGIKPGHKPNSSLKRKTPKRHFSCLPVVSADTRRKPVQSEQPALDTIPKVATSQIWGCQDTVWQGHEQSDHGRCGWWLSPAPGSAALGGPLAACAQCRGVALESPAWRAARFPDYVASKPHSQTLLEVF